MGFESLHYDQSKSNRQDIAILSFPQRRISDGKRAIRGGFAAMTPKQSGAATTSASVIGTPCVVAASLCWGVFWL